MRDRLDAGEWRLPQSDSYFRPLLTAEGFEIDHLEAALKYVAGFRTAVDGGAHIGTWAARMAASFGRVMAFEPARDTFECLCSNTAEFDNVEEIPSALGSSRMFGAIRDDPLRAGNTGARFVTEGRDFLIEKLDDYELRDLDFLKLDLEGYEYFALLGAQQTVRRCRPVVLIEDKDFGNRYGLERGVAAALLAGWGMKEAERVRNDRIFVW